MAFFDKLGETISTTSRAAAHKTREVADLAKLSSQASQLEGKIKSWYQVIGEKVYQSEKDQDHSGMEAEFDMITEAFAEIGRIKKQIADIRGVKYCPECGAEVSKDSAFCNKCGAKVEEAEAVPEEEGAAADVVEDVPAAEEAVANAAEEASAEATEEACGCEEPEKESDC